MEKLGEKGGLLVDVMNERKLEKESIIAIMITLKTQKDYEIMLDWLKKNEQAGQEEIINHLYEMGVTSS